MCAFGMAVLHLSPAGGEPCPEGRITTRSNPWMRPWARGGWWAKRPGP